MKFIIIGAPGSGKGTLAKQIVEHHNLHHINAGELLRAKSEEDNESGKLIASLINNGNYVPDDTIRKIIEEEIQKYPDFILDGFPRTIKQLRMINKFFEDLDEKEKPMVIVLQVGKQTALERIKKRSLDSNRKDDNSNEILRIRMTEFIKKTQPVVNHYLRLTNSIVLDANKNIEEVFEDFQSKINDAQIL